VCAVGAAHVGDTVTWPNLEPEFPHTITFGTEPSGGPFGAFAPSGVDAPGHATLTAPGQSVNSGFIGADLPFGTQFRATFTAPGAIATSAPFTTTLAWWAPFRSFAKSQALERAPRSSDTESTNGATHRKIGSGQVTA